MGQPAKHGFLHKAELTGDLALPSADVLPGDINEEEATGHIDGLGAWSGSVGLHAHVAAGA